MGPRKEKGLLGAAMGPHTSPLGRNAATRPPKEKGVGVCGNGAAHTQVGKERGDGAVKINGGGGACQRDHTRSGREGTRPRRSAKKKEGVCGNEAANTQTQVGEKRGDEAPRRKGVVG